MVYLLCNYVKLGNKGLFVSLSLSTQQHNNMNRKMIH